MFTGIVAEVGKTISAQSDKLVVGASRVLKDVELGGSIAINGACLTVTGFNSNSFSVDLSPETLRRTNLGTLKSGDPVNLERPLELGGELGGHLVQGHVDNTGRIVSVTPEGGATIIRIEAPADILRYVVEKGFIAVDGISLTVTAKGTGYFQVSVVNYTWENTILKYRISGDLVNLEVDIIAKYAEQFILIQRPQLTVEYLRENGF